MEHMYIQDDAWYVIKQFLLNPDKIKWEKNITNVHKELVYTYNKYENTIYWQFIKPESLKLRILYWQAPHHDDDFMVTSINPIPWIKNRLKIDLLN
jgi:hypothetical protein